MIRQETIVRILLESEIGSIENDGTLSRAGNINRTQYHDVADKILKLVVQPDVIKSVGNGKNILRALEELRAEFTDEELKELQRQLPTVL